MVKKDIRVIWACCPNCGCDKDLLKERYKEDENVESRVTFCDGCGCVISELYVKDYKAYTKLRDVVLGPEYVVEA